MRRTHLLRKHRNLTGGLKSVFEVLDGGWFAGWTKDGDDIKSHLSFEKIMLLEVEQGGASEQSLLSGIDSFGWRSPLIAFACFHFDENNA